MKFSKGTIKNLNKRLLSGALCLTLIMVPLSGCDSSKLRYKENSQGEMVCINNIKYQYIKKYKVVVLEIEDDIVFYIAKPIQLDPLGTGVPYADYYNVFGGQLVYSTKDDDSKIKKIYDEYLTNYLISYDKVKEEYSEQELKEILELIKIDFKKQINRQLVK